MQHDCREERVTIMSSVHRWMCTGQQHAMVVAWLPASFVLLMMGSFLRSRVCPVVPLPRVGDEVMVGLVALQAITTSWPSPEAAKTSPEGSRLRAATPACNKPLAGPEFRSSLLDRLTCSASAKHT